MGDICYLALSESVSVVCRVFH